MERNIKGKELRRIANFVCLKTSFVSSLGLYNGRMGHLLFLAHYTHFSKSPYYNELAEQFIDEICSRIKDDLPINFATGLCGIAWGILYLLQNNFIEGDPNDILYEIDKKIMERDLSRINDPSFETGLNGILYYIQSRLLFTKCFQTSPFDSIYLSNYENVKNHTHLNDWNINSLIGNNHFDIHTNPANWNLGLEKGCSGYGLKLVLS